MLEVLQAYEMSLGQQLNKAKTTVFFIKSTKKESVLMAKIRSNKK